jgi:hypothetical protein
MTECIVSGLVLWAYGLQLELHTNLNEYSLTEVLAAARQDPRVVARVTCVPGLLGPKKKTGTGLQREALLCCVCMCAFHSRRRMGNPGQVSLLTHGLIQPGLGLCCENLTEHDCSYLSRFPFYYELKIAFVAWLLSPYTKGSSLLYRKFVHPTLSSKEKVIYLASSKWKIKIGK